MILSASYANAYLNFLLGKVTTLTAPSKVYLGFSSTATEGEDGSFTELSGGNYERVLVSINGEAYPDFLGTAADRTITNVKQIAMNKASAAWDNALGAGFFTTLTGGTPFAYGDLTQPLVVAEGAVALLEPGMLNINCPEESA